MRQALLAIALGLVFAAGTRAADPEWIWLAAESRDGEVVYFRKTFEVPETFGAKLGGKMRITCDNHLKLWVNGNKVAESDEWEVPLGVDVGKHLTPGHNVIAVEGKNDGGPAGLIMQLDVSGANRRKMMVVTDTSWRVAPKVPDGWRAVGFDDAKWKQAHSVAKLGGGPWGNVFQGAPSITGKGTATPAESLTLLPGFKAELLYSVPRGEQGSWVNMCFDPQGRLIVSNQNGILYRVTVDKPEKGQVQVEPIEVRTRPGATPIGKAHGLCHAFGSLYVMIADGGGEGNGLYRLHYDAVSDKYDKAELLMKINGGGEHGPHAVRLSPDGKSLYVIAGNHTKLPKIESSRVVERWDEDQLLPRMPDAGGHAVGIMAPGGWICRIDPDAKHWELICSGFRNAFDFDFNTDGELFTYDADMEWDIGLPWYRPTRICHCVSGAEFGWRNGSGKWPEYFPDSLPPVVNIGLGSPTGIAFGTGAKFPAKYQRAMFALDWTYGIIYAVHLYPKGATYIGEPERFLSGKPLPVTDCAFGPDGALYFTIGGRGTQSGLYRVTYNGKESTAALWSKEVKFDQTRMQSIRRIILESFHGRQDPKAIETAWPYLKDADRFIRYAARTAVEHQPVTQWRSRALTETDPEAMLTILVALARCGDKTDLAPLLSHLNTIDWQQLTEMQRLELLRAYSLAVVRLGKPEPGQAQEVIAKLSPHFPAPSFEMNRELSALLLVLGAPDAVAKTMALLRAAPTPREQVAFAYNLRPIGTGWTFELRKEYFEWYKVAANYRGGHSLVGYIKNMKTEAIAHLNWIEKALLSSVINAKPVSLKSAEAPKPRPFVKEWTMADLVPVAEKGMAKRDFNRGRAMYAAAQCAACHRFDGDGGAFGPDLTGVSGRFNVRDLLESIVEPSKVISDQYVSTTLHLANGKDVTGRVVDEKPDRVRLVTDGLKPDQITDVPKSQVESREVSKVSSMPVGLLNTLTKDEILDLLAYLLSGGDRGHAAFK
jgi:putative heme-binding domain-containing protein